MHLSVNHAVLSNMYKVMSKFSRPSGVIHNDSERHVIYGEHAIDLTKILNL